MRKIIFIFLVLTLFAGCKTSKTLDLKDTSTVSTETEKKETTRKGDSISVERAYNIQYKDTTIITYSYETKSYIRETYDKEGNQKIDCVTDELRELIETTKKLAENNIALSEQKTAEFNPAGLIWAIAGLAGVLILALVFGLFAFISLKRALPEMVAQAVTSAVNK